MDELARLHVSPFVVWAMARSGFLGTATARLTTELQAFQKRAGTKIVHGAERMADVGDAVARLRDECCGSA